MKDEALNPLEKPQPNEIPVDEGEGWANKERHMQINPSLEPAPGGIHHSDQGVQYASGQYTALLKQHEFRISMSRRGNPYDNPVAESFFKTLKVEEVYLADYRTEAEARARIPYFIDQVYNQERLHSALGYRPPNEFEIMYKQPPTYVLTPP